MSVFYKQSISLRMLYLGFLTHFFLLGLQGVAETSSSRACENKPMKEKEVHNDVEGVDGVVGVKGGDRLSVSYGLSDSLEDSSEWKGKGFVSISRSADVNASIGSEISTSQQYSS